MNVVVRLLRLTFPTFAKLQHMMLSPCCFCPGARCFLAQMNVQRAELLERLSTAHNFCNLDDEDNYIAANKAVRQVGGFFKTPTSTSFFKTDFLFLSLTALCCLAWLQVIHQLKQLATVWQDVLPVSIYCKAMGNLLNTAITEIIAKIMMLEVCHCSCIYSFRMSCVKRK